MTKNYSKSMRCFLLFLQYRSYILASDVKPLRNYLIRCGFCQQDLDILTNFNECNDYLPLSGMIEALQFVSLLHEKNSVDITTVQGGTIEDFIKTLNEFKYGGY